MATIGKHRAYMRRCLRDRRIALGLSQAAAARQCGVFRAYYAGCENGHGKAVTLERLIGLIECLGLQVDIRVTTAQDKLSDSTQLVTL